VLGVEGLGVDVDRFALGVAAEIALRQRRALVRTVVLGADQRDAPVEAFITQRLGGLCAGESSAGGSDVAEPSAAESSAAESSADESNAEAPDAAVSVRR